MAAAPSSPTPGTTMMARETAEAPAVVGGQLAANAALVRALGERLRARPPALVVTCARGSSDHAATFAKYLIEIRLGVPVASAAPSVSSVYRARQKLDHALFLAISQSGRSPDLLACAEMARKGGAVVVALVNDEASPLAALAELCLPLHAGAERSVAATKSYIAALAALLQLTAHWAEDPDLLAALERLPGWLAAALEQDWRAALEPLASASDLLVVGRGPGFAIAQEAALKLKEAAALHAEAFSAAEIQHGPLELVREGYPVLAFRQEDASRDSVRSLLARLQAKGARVFVAEEGPPAPGRLPVPPAMDPACALLAMIESCYVLVDALAIRRGRNPDLPRHLEKVTETR